MEASNITVTHYELKGVVGWVVYMTGNRKSQQGFTHFRPFWDALADTDLESWKAKKKTSIKRNVNDSGQRCYTVFFLSLWILIVVSE